MATSEALKNLWWTTVVVLSFIGALVLVRLFYWPPDVSSAPDGLSGGFLKFLGILIFGYVVFCIWHYALKPIGVVFLGSRRSREPKACFIALIKQALPSAGILCIPMALAIALELPDPFDIAPVALVFAAIWYVRRFTSNAVEQIQAECF